MLSTRRFASQVICYLGMLLGIRASYAEPATLRIQQVSQFPAPLTVYFTVEDIHEQPLIDLPLLPHPFSATLGDKPIDITAAQPFTSAEEGVAYLLLIDVSKSINARQFAPLRTALQEWVAALRPRDQVALLTFGTTVEWAQAFTGDKVLLEKGIANLKSGDAHTRLYSGLRQALEASRRQDDGLPRRRVIVLLSDGQDDFAGGATVEEISAMLRDQRIPIFALGFSRLPRTTEKENALKTLAFLARSSGGAYQTIGEQTWPVVFAEMRRRIDQAFVVRLKVPESLIEKNTQRISIVCTMGQKRFSDGLEVRLIAQSPPPAPILEPPATPKPVQPIPQEVDPKPQTEESSDITWWYWVVAVGAIVFYGLVWRRLFRRQSHKRRVNPLPGNAMPSPVERMPPKHNLRFTVLGHPQSQAFSVAFTERMLVGREPDCHITLQEDKGVSGIHCAIAFAEGRFFIEDLNSTNGTLLNGVPIYGRYPLQDGDCMTIGRTQFRVNMLDK